MAKTEYKWRYGRTNSKGEVILRHDTEQELAHVCDVLERENILYEIKGAATMIKIKTSWQDYAYYWTTGRWSPYTSGMSKKHYRSKGIEDFLYRFCKPYNGEK